MNNVLADNIPVNDAVPVYPYTGKEVSLKMVTPMKKKRDNRKVIKIKKYNRANDVLLVLLIDFAASMHEQIKHSSDESDLSLSICRLITTIHSNFRLNYNKAQTSNIHKSLWYIDKLIRDTELTLKSIIMILIIMEHLFAEKHPTFITLFGRHQDKIGYSLKLLRAEPKYKDIIKYHYNLLELIIELAKDKSTNVDYDKYLSRATYEHCNPKDNKFKAMYNKNKEKTVNRQKAILTLLPEFSDTEETKRVLGHEEFNDRIVEINTNLVDREFKIALLNELKKDDDLDNELIFIAIIHYLNETAFELLYSIRIALPKIHTIQMSKIERQNLEYLVDKLTNFEM